MNTIIYAALLAALTLTCRAQTLPTCPTNYVSKTRGRCVTEKPDFAPTRSATCTTTNPSTGRCTEYTCSEGETLRNRNCFGPCPEGLTLVGRKCRNLGNSPVTPTCAEGLFVIDGICYTTSKKPANGQGTLPSCPTNYRLKVKSKCVRVKAFFAPSNDPNEQDACNDGQVRKGQMCYGPCPSGLTLVNRKCKKRGARKTTPLCPSGQTLTNGVCVGNIVA